MGREGEREREREREGEREKERQKRGVTKSEMVLIQKRDRDWKDGRGEGERGWAWGVERGSVQPSESSIGLTAACVYNSTLPSLLTLVEFVSFGSSTSSVRLQKGDLTSNK